MLRALYDFQAPYENTLTFAKEDLFIVLKRSNKDTNWLHVVNLHGVNGYVPTNYLTTAQCTLVEELQYVEQVFKRVEAAKRVNKDQTAVIENLKEIRNKLEVDLEELAARHTYELTSMIREETKCQFNDAYAACLATIDYLKNNVVHIPGGLERILRVDVSRISYDIRRQSEDCRKLEQLVTQVMEVCDDQETHLAEDTWSDLLFIITHADSVLCISALERHDCSMILRLIQHLQVETLWRKRKYILQILFNALQLHPVFQNVALTSILPAELARDIQANGTNKDRIYWSVRLLTVTLCSSECIPYSHRNVMEEEFISNLLNILEVESVSIATAEERDDDPNLAVAVLHVILALNMQFQKYSNEDNAILQYLSRQRKCTSLVENVILLYNRGDDPLKDFMFVNPGTDSVTRLILELFSNSQTASLFYTADLEVLLDVILRQMTDNSPGDQDRTSALRLFRSITRTCSVSYRKSDFTRCLRDICDESQRLGWTNAAIQRDRNLILKIYHEYPDYIFT